MKPTKKIIIKTTKGSVEVNAAVVKGNLAIYHSLYYWNVTHIGTGKYLATVSSKRDAIEIMNRLLEIDSWSFSALSEIPRSRANFLNSEINKTIHEVQSRKGKQ